MPRKLPSKTPKPEDLKDPANCDLCGELADGGTLCWGHRAMLRQLSRVHGTKRELVDWLLRIGAAIEERDCDCEPCLLKAGQAEAQLK